MTEFKRRILFLSTGKQLRLFGNSMAIGPSLEVGEGAAPNLFARLDGQSPGVPGEATAPVATVLNPYRLTPEELQEVADYNIRLWLELKDRLRKFGGDNPKVFVTEPPR